VVSQICGIAPKIKMNHSDPSMDRNVRIFRQLGHIFETFCVMFRELKGKIEAAPVMFLKGKDKICAKNGTMFSSGLSVFRGLSKVYLGLWAKCLFLANFSQNCNM
jgi:hypothetical protein